MKKHFLIILVIVFAICSVSAKGSSYLGVTGGYPSLANVEYDYQITDKTTLYCASGISMNLGGYEGVNVLGGIEYRLGSLFNVMNAPEKVLNVDGGLQGSFSYNPCYDSFWNSVSIQLGATLKLSADYKFNELPCMFFTRCGLGIGLGNVFKIPAIMGKSLGFSFFGQAGVVVKLH